MVLRVILVLLSLAGLTGAEIPETAPIPLPKPATAAPVDPAPTPVPVPSAPPEKPALPPATAPDTTKTDDKKSDAESPAGVDEEKKHFGPDRPETPAEPPPPPIEAQSDEDFAVCTKALADFGAQFSPVPRIDDEDGCGIDKPIRISQLMTGVKLSPEATVRCDTALALARWVKTVVVPAAETAMPDKGRLTGINQASGYVCRLRNGAASGKISEHARGNAIDLISFTFANGTVPLFIVTAEESSFAAAFQRALNATACLYFSTVLSPGSDAAHQDHMHLDVLERRGGYRYCR